MCNAVTDQRHEENFLPVGLKILARSRKRKRKSILKIKKKYRFWLFYCNNKHQQVKQGEEF